MPINQTEALYQYQYGLDELQLKECKEKLEKKEFLFLLVMDNYDEMKKNLYLNNKLKQNWQNLIIIFTKSREIDKQKLFCVVQTGRQEYIKRNQTSKIEFSINRNIQKIFQFRVLKFIYKKRNIIDRGKSVELKINKLYSSFFLEQQVYIFKSHDALRSLSLNLQKLWSVKKYDKMIRQINLNKLMVTPFMMDIVVQVVALNINLSVTIEKTFGIKQLI
ncbi:unnamed protein product [Paramecium primaurelia]|uniref:Uncharacterized protein n=1 Tax=Paramecium primaurelia TaxID=5886 RepID=A0A8S1KHN0_PARPR|nr:unnamed protein product [Paramecium primaurelia]